MKITKEALEQIISTVGKAVPETGGILGAKKSIVCAFYFDNATSPSSEYHPHTESLNRKLQKWSAQGIEFSGLAHSHPNGYNGLSESDIEAIKLIMTVTNHRNTLYFPIVTNKDGEIKVTVHKAVKNQSSITIQRDKITVTTEED